MHRQGIPAKDIEKAFEMIKKYKKLNLEGLCTHFADADNPKNNLYTKEQNKLFNKAEKIFTMSQWAKELIIKVHHINEDKITKSISL